MNEADALSFVINELNIYLSGNTPASPAGIRWMLNEIHHRLGEKRKTAAKEINIQGAHDYEQSCQCEGCIAYSRKLNIKAANLKAARPYHAKGCRINVDGSECTCTVVATSHPLPLKPDGGCVSAIGQEEDFPVRKPAATPTRPCEPGETADVAIKIGDGPWQEFKSDPFQHYWRCEHYPIALENFFDGRECCSQRGCPKNEEHRLDL